MTATPATAAVPALDDHFVEGSLLGLLRRGHPYDFAETYRVLEHLYGYRSRAVNLGHWRPSELPGTEALDAGQRLVHFLVERVRAQRPDPEGAGARDVLDVGAGLGQGSLELARHFPGSRVVGVNVNERQLAFARALIAARGLSERVAQQRVDACGGLAPAFGADAFDVALAVECVGHFRDPAAFFTDVARVLRPGGVLAVCMNVATAALPIQLRALLRASYGFVPATLETWLGRARDAGLRVRESGDLTGAVLRDGCAAVRARLDGAKPAEIGRGARLLVSRQIAVARAAVERGALGYAWFIAARS